MASSPVAGLECDEAAGSEQRYVRVCVQIHEPLVGAGHHLGRAMAFARVRVHRGPQPPHQRRGEKVVSLDVTDDQGYPPALEPDGVVEVSADLHS